MTSSVTSPDAPNHHASLPGFSGVAGVLAGLSMLAGRGAIARLAADLAGVKAGDSVVDLGCGPGAAAREAARRGATVTGVDPAPVMLALARSLTRAATPVTWVEGAAERIPLPDATASVVWTIATVHHWPDLKAGLAEVQRVLSPGGRLLAIERRTRPGATGLASHGWTDRQAAVFAGLCPAAGFGDVRAETRRAGRYILLIVHAVKPAG